MTGFSVLFSSVPVLTDCRPANDESTDGKQNTVHHSNYASLQGYIITEVPTPLPSVAPTKAAMQSPSFITLCYIALGHAHDH